MKVVLDGGPFDGREIETSGAPHVIRMPVSVQQDYFRKVVPFRHGPELSMEVVEYIRMGGVYRYEHLIDDAWADVEVSAQALAEGGPVVRRLVREQLRECLENLEPKKEVDRIVWRLSTYRPLMTYRIRALVGPHRVERGLKERSERLAR